MVSSPFDLVQAKRGNPTAVNLATLMESGRCRSTARLLLHRRRLRLDRRRLLGRGRSGAGGGGAGCTAVPSDSVSSVPACPLGALALFQTLLALCLLALFFRRGQIQRTAQTAALQQRSEGENREAVSAWNRRSRRAQKSSMSFPPTALQAARPLQRHVVLRHRIELGLRLSELGAEPLHHPPESHRMVELLQMRELVRDDIVDHRRGRLHQAPVEAHLALGVAASPARARAGDEYARRRRRPGPRCKCTTRSRKWTCAWRRYHLTTAARTASACAGSVKRNFAGHLSSCSVASA